MKFEKFKDNLYKSFNIEELPIFNGGDILFSF